MNILTSVDNCIDDITKECKIHRFASELQNTIDEERKAHIRKILAVLQTIKTEESIITQARTKLDKVFDNINKSALKKNWNKLTSAQKQDRFNAYINTVENDDDKMLITELFNTDQKRCNVTYDSSNGMIITIDIAEEETKPNKKNKK